MDPEIFLRHSEISDTYHIRLDFLRDFKNCLKLLNREDHSDFTEELEKDSYRLEIAKLAHRVFHQECWKDDKQEKVIDLLKENVTPQTRQIYKDIGTPMMKNVKTLDQFVIQIYIEIDILQNGEVIKSKIFTGVKFSYELDETLEIPLRVCDLAPLSSLAISIYDMDRVEEEPIASTVIDLFDGRHRLRQGTWNCMLHIDQKPDLTTKCTTAALTSNQTCVELNNALRQIRKWRKKVE